MQLRFFFIIYALLASIYAYGGAPIRDAKLSGAGSEVTSGTLTVKSGASLVAASGSIANFAGATLVFDSGQIPWASINSSGGAFAGDTGAGGSLGLVPAPAAGDAAAGKFLSAGGTWRVLEPMDLPVMTGASDLLSGAAGAVPAPMAGSEGKYLRGDGMWATISGGALATLSDVALTTPAPNQVLSFDGTAWVNTSSMGGGLSDPTTATGDLLVRDSAGVNRLPVGLDGEVLMVDSTEETGVRWGMPAGGGGGSTRDSIMLSGTTSVSINNNSSAPVQWPSILVDNNDLYLSASTVKIKRGGLYLVDVRVSFAPSANGIRKLSVSVNHSGTPRIFELIQPAVEATSPIILNGSFVHRFKADDQLIVWVYQNSGGALSLESGKPYARFWSVVQLTD